MKKVGQSQRYSDDYWKDCETKMAEPAWNQKVRIDKLHARLQFDNYVKQMEEEYEQTKAEMGAAAEREQQEAARKQEEELKEFRKWKDSQGQKLDKDT